MKTKSKTIIILINKSIKWKTNKNYQKNNNLIYIKHLIYTKKTQNVQKSTIKKIQTKRQNTKLTHNTKNKKNYNYMII